ncbi:MAG: hypothetical protein ACFE8U_17430, partial [Candidatus Hermodarchaeota archaeon]
MFKSNKNNDELDRTPKAPSELRKIEEKSHLLDSSHFSSLPLKVKIEDESLTSLQSRFDKLLLPLADYKGLSTLINGTSNVYSVSCSPNTNVLATGFSNGSVILLNLTTGRTLWAQYQGSTIRSVDFHPNGSVIASGADDGTINFWKVNTGNLIKALNAHPSRVNSIRFSPDGKLLASGSNDWTIKLWNITSTISRFKTLDDHIDDVNAIAFHENSSVIASGSVDKYIKLWDIGISSNATLKDLNTGDEVNAIAYSTDGKYIVAGSGWTQKNISIWDGKTGNSIGSIANAHTNEILAITIDPTNTFMVSGSADKHVKVWNIASRREIRNMTEHGGSVNSLCFTGNILVSGSNDDTIKIWNLGLGNIKEKLIGHDASVNSVDFNANGTLIASGSVDTNITVWNLESGDILWIDESNFINSVDFSPTNNSLLVAGSRSDTVNIQLWDVDSNTFIPLSNQTSFVEAVAFHPNGRFFVSGSRDRSIALWDVKTKKTIDSIKFPTISTYSLSLGFNPSGSILVSGLNNGSLVFLDFQTFTPFLTLNNHSDEITSVSFSPDGEYIISGSKNSTILVHNATSYEFLYKIDTHSSDINTLAFSPDGTVFASGSDDEIIGIWNTSNGKNIHWLNASNQVSSIAFNPLGNQLVSGHILENDINIWNISSFLFAFENRSSSIVIRSSSQFFMKNLDVELYAGWNTSILTLVTNSTAFRTPSTFGYYVLHVSATYLGHRRIRDYQLLVVATYNDYDGDQMPNWWEEDNSLEILEDDADEDPDNDDLTNLQEFEEGTIFNNSDTDNDGWMDGSEVNAGSDPLVTNDPPTVRWSIITLNLNNEVTSVSTWNWTVKSTNAENIELWHNGISLGVQNNTFKWSVSLVEGNNSISVQAWYDYRYNTYSFTFNTFYKPKSPFDPFFIITVIIATIVLLSVYYSTAIYALRRRREYPYDGKPTIVSWDISDSTKLADLTEGKIELRTNFLEGFRTLAKKITKTHKGDPY